MKLIEGRNPVYEIGKEPFDVVLVGTSPYQSLANGFQLQMKNKFPYIEMENNSTNYGDRRLIGKIHRCEKVGNDPEIVLCYICNYPTSKPYISYEGLRDCMSLVNSLYKGKVVATTILGSSRFDGLGDKTKCMDIICTRMASVDLRLYDYEQKSFHQMRKEATLKFREMKKQGIDIMLKDYKKQIYLEQ